jgi:acyl dehydratase
MTMIEWFDDLPLGCNSRVVKLGLPPQTSSASAEFDPQPMHLDEDTAAKTFFNGLAASGWHTAAISAVQRTLNQMAALHQHRTLLKCAF